MCPCVPCQCAILNEKLESLLQTLDSDSKPLSLPSLATPPIVEEEQDEEEEASEESFTELKEKLEEEETEKGGDHREPPLQLYKSREQLMLRANSLKKAVRQIIEQAVRGISGKETHLNAENMLKNVKKKKYAKNVTFIHAESKVICLPSPFPALVVDEQNALTEDTELPSPLEFQKDSEEENRDSEKEEDTKELEAVSCEFLLPRPLLL